MDATIGRTLEGSIQPTEAEPDTSVNLLMLGSAFAGCIAFCGVQSQEDSGCPPEAPAEVAQSHPAVPMWLLLTSS